MAQVVADNDVLLKGACYRLLIQLADKLEPHEAVGILGAAKFVVSHRLGTLDSVMDGDGALAEFNAFMELATELEPSSDETELATAIEEEAQRAGVEVDSGESQLAAIAVRRATYILLTGDKRAIAGLEVVAAYVPEMASLRGSIASLEQLVLTFASSLGLEEVRTRVCAERHVDQALSISLSCNSGGHAVTPDGLASYIQDLRAQAPTLLVLTDQLPWGS